MAWTQWLLLKFPTPVLGVVAVLAALIFAVAGLILVCRLIPHHRLKLHHDVAGPIFGTVGVIYAVLLAFVFIVVWEDFDKARFNTEKEANCLADIYRDAEGFPPVLKEKVRSAVKDYARLVVTDEWKSLSSGQASPAVAVLLDDLWKTYAAYCPQTENARVFYAESVARLNALGELRDTRLIASRTGIPGLLWLILLTGGAVTVAFTFFFGAESLKTQMVMAILLALLIALIIFTIFLFDFPFTGSVTISPRAFAAFSPGA